MDIETQNHLRSESRKQFLPQDHAIFLAKLKMEGFTPKVIYDIGSSLLHWTSIAKQIWPEAKFFCFDGMESLRFLYDEAGIEFISAILSDSSKKIGWYEREDSPGGNSIYPEKAHTEGMGKFKWVTTQTLDYIVEAFGLPAPEFIKMDTQGSEMDILKGAPKTLKSVKRLILEQQHKVYNIGAPMAGDVREYVESLDFFCDSPLFCNNGQFDGDYSYVRIEE